MTFKLHAAALYAQWENGMYRIENILVATDYSEFARRAETRAAILSVELNVSTLEILSVQETRFGLNTPATASQSTEVDTASAIEFLVDARRPVAQRRSANSLQCIRAVAEGKPATAIVRRADEMNAHLTVVAARVRGLLPNIFTRSPNDDVLRLSQRPVLLVHTDPNKAYSKVLVAVDFSEEAHEAARVALAIAPSAHFTFLHAYQRPGLGTGEDDSVREESLNAVRTSDWEKARAELNQFITQLGPRKQLISRAIHYGSPTSVILGYAKRISADLIAMGNHDKSSLDECRLGSNIQQMMERAMCDMLVASVSAAGGWDHRPAA